MHQRQRKEYLSSQEGQGLLANSGGLSLPDFDINCRDYWYYCYRLEYRLKRKEKQYHMWYQT